MAKPAIILRGWKGREKTPLKIVAQVVNYENHRRIETKDGERPVCDVRATLPSGTKVYEEIQVRQTTNDWSDEFGLFVSGIGKDNPDRRKTSE